MSESLESRCLRCVQRVAAAERWPLPPEGIHLLASRILPHVIALSPTDDATIELVARHYYEDGPRVEVMLSQGSENARQWSDVHAFFLQLAHRYKIEGIEPQDVAQEACARAIAGLRGYHFTASLSTWLFTVFRNTRYSILRRQRAKKRRPAALRHPESEGAEAVPPAIVSLDTIQEDQTALCELIPDESTSTPEALAVATDMRERVMTVLEQLLGAIDVRILRLYYWKGWTDREIASSLGWPLNTVTSRRRRAIIRLRRDPTLRALAEEWLALRPG